MSNLVIAIGGTGARCAEAVAHLAAAGVYGGPVRLLLIDLDQANGNLDRARQTVARYQDLYEAAAGGSLFAHEISLDIWQPPHDPRAARDTSFGAYVGRDRVSEEVGHFLDLFFSRTLYGFDMTGGCFQHPEIGSIVLRSALRRSLDEEGGALRRCVERVANDLQGGSEVRVFVVGSVFGGTGASGLPYVPGLFRTELPRRWEALRHHGERLRLGGALLAPYFQWRGQPERNDGSDGPDANRLSPHAKAVLQHYVKHPPAYDALYVLGAPELYESGDYAERGNGQANSAHYIELVTALAAADFFQRQFQRPFSGETAFFYAESTQGDQQKVRQQKGINWESLPEGVAAKHAVLRWTIASLFLESHVLPGMEEGRFSGYPWFEDTVGGRLPAGERELLTGAVQGYRRWLAQILESVTAAGGGTDHPSLLPLKADQLGILQDGAVEAAAEQAPGLVLRGESEPRDFSALCAGMDEVKPRDVKAKDGGRTSLGRLVLTVDRAVSGLMTSKPVKKAIGDWKAGEPSGRRELEQSRYLPKVVWEPNVQPEPGNFAPGDRLLLARIANGLVVGRADVGDSNPISSPWARALLFETALTNGSIATREAAVTAWRSLVGILAFRRYLGGGNALSATPLDLETEAGAYGSALAEFVYEAQAYRQRQWLTFHTLRFSGEPIGGTSPLTLVFPSPRLGRSAAIQLVPWFDHASGTLGDPAEHFDRREELRAYNALLKAWLNHLLRPGGVLDDKVQRGFASNVVRQEIQKWLQEPAMTRVAPHPGFIPEADDQLLGDFTLPAIPANAAD